MNMQRPSLYEAPFAGMSVHRILCACRYVCLQVADTMVLASYRWACLHHHYCATLKCTITAPLLSASASSRSAGHCHLVLPSWSVTITAPFLYINKLSPLHLRPCLHHCDCIVLLDHALNVLSGPKGSFNGLAHLADARQQLLAVLRVPHQLVLHVVHTARLGGVHGDALIQASTCIALQVLAIGVGAEDQGLAHKHALALAGVTQHLRRVQVLLVCLESHGAACHHAADKGLAQAADKLAENLVGVIV
mmetsp:Transcript_19626/g.54712  ORF Transcript_19626/g.54712 Transcript_19626/m.54712 type:complete len:249 (-) Transcript_19626:4165-4911(-)